MERPKRLDMGGAFTLAAYVILGLAVLAALLVFAYGWYLSGARDAKAQQLIGAQQAISEKTVSDFVRLRDRLTSAGALLDKHVTLSAFLDALDKLTLKTVHFTSLKISLKNDGTADLEMAGVAKTFNALAAQSAAFSAESGIKRSVFSSIAVGADGTVNFTMTASLDPSITTGAYPTAAVPPPSDSATATTTP